MRCVRASSCTPFRLLCVDNVILRGGGSGERTGRRRRYDRRAYYKCHRTSCANLATHHCTNSDETPPAFHIHRPFASTRLTRTVVSDRNVYKPNRDARSPSDAKYNSKDSSINDSRRDSDIALLLVDRATLLPIRKYYYALRINTSELSYYLHFLRLGLHLHTRGDDLSVFGCRYTNCFCKSMLVITEL